MFLCSFGQGGGQVSAHRFVEKEVIIKELEKVVQEEMFEIEVQYCDPDDCLQDCMESGYNNCTAVVTGWW